MRASHTAQPRSAFGGTVAHLPDYPPPDYHTTTRVQNGGGTRVGVSRLQTYPRLAHASSAFGNYLKIRGKTNQENTSRLVRMFPVAGRAARS